MSTNVNHIGDLPAREAPLTITKPSVISGLLWFTFAISSIVWIEPAPFDFMIIVLVGVGVISGYRLPPGLAVPLSLLGVLAVTGLIGGFASDTVVESTRHTVISIFLYAFTISLTAFVTRDPRRMLPAIIGGQAIAALVAASVGVFVYFFLTADINAEIFTDQGRVRGTFKDPNVFGPFLTIPIVYWFVLQLAGQQKFIGLHTAAAAILCFGLLLSFSRGAWGGLGLSIGVAAYLLFVTSRSIAMRLKIMGLTALIALLATGGLIFALSFDTIGEMMSLRGKLLQPYDLDQRFAGARLALEIILENPLGFGSASFNNLHGNEPHNVYLFHFLIAGWVGGIAYILLVAYTLLLGLRSALLHHPQQLLAIMLFATFLALAVEGLIIDTDHWRHFYMLMACIWGLHFHQMEVQNPERSSSPSKSEAGRRPVRVLTAVLRTRDAVLSRGESQESDTERSVQPVATDVASARPVFGMRDLEKIPRRGSFGRRREPPGK